MARAANMQALTNDVKREWPGVVVYGIGDTPHKARASGHNEDDTPGSRPELEDADSRPEHRAIDIMVRGPFTKAAADALVARLLADSKARARLFYIIWNGYQWSRSSGWVRRKYTGSDQHTDHVHASGWAADDENTASWPAVATKKPEAPMTLSTSGGIYKSGDGPTERGALGDLHFAEFQGNPQSVVQKSLARIESRLNALAAQPAAVIDYDQLADALLRKVLGNGTQG